MKAYNESIFQGALGQLFDAIFKPFKPKRNPIVKVRRISRRPNPITGRTFSTWHWQCALCDHHLNPRETGSTHYSELSLTWADAYRRADRHARTHPPQTTESTGEYLCQLWMLFALSALWIFISALNALAKSTRATRHKLFLATRSPNAHYL